MQLFYAREPLHSTVLYKFDLSFVSFLLPNKECYSCYFSNLQLIIFCVIFLKQVIMLTVTVFPVCYIYIRFFFFCQLTYVDWIILVNTILLSLHVHTREQYVVMVLFVYKQTQSSIITCQKLFTLFRLICIIQCSLHTTYLFFPCDYYNSDGLQKLYNNICYATFYP